MLEVRLQSSTKVLRGIPSGPTGTVVIGILMGSGNALGWNTRANSILLPADPANCWIWSKWGADRLERYRYLDTSPEEPSCNSWRPIKYVGGGQREDGETEGTIGPEASLAAARYDQLRPHAVNRDSLSYGIIKMAAPDVTARVSKNPRKSMCMNAGGYDEETGEEGTLDALWSVLVESIGEAVADLTERGKLVLFDAIYTDLGTDDCCDFDGTSTSARLLPERLEAIWASIQSACSDKNIPLVGIRPLFNSSHAPLANTELARYKLEDMAESVPGFHLAQADDLSRQVDGVHFGASAQLGFGMRLAAVFDRATTQLTEQGICDPVAAPVIR